MKLCKRCNTLKPIAEFSKDVQKKDGVRPDCKCCNRERQTLLRKQMDQEELKTRNKAYRDKNKDYINLRKRIYAKENPDKAKAWSKRTWDKNKEKWKPQRDEYRKRIYPRLKALHDERYKTDLQYKLSLNLRRRMCKLIKRQERGGSAVRDLGCSFEQFIAHIEKQFAPGMTWENYGKWHLDHILPLSHFDLSDRTQFLKVAHYTNYQPLWAADNLSKSDKLNWQKQYQQ